MNEHENKCGTATEVVGCERSATNERLNSLQLGGRGARTTATATHPGRSLREDRDVRLALNLAKHVAKVTVILGGCSHVSPLDGILPIDRDKLAHQTGGKHMRMNLGIDNRRRAHMIVIAIIGEVLISNPLLSGSITLLVGGASLGSGFGVTRNRLQNTILYGGEVWNTWRNHGTEDHRFGVIIFGVGSGEKVKINLTEATTVEERVQRGGVLLLLDRIGGRGEHIGLEEDRTAAGQVTAEFGISIKGAHHVGDQQLGDTLSVMAGAHMEVRDETAVADSKISSDNTTNDTIGTRVMNIHSKKDVELARVNGLLCIRRKISDPVLQRFRIRLQTGEEKVLVELHQILHGKVGTQIDHGKASSADPRQSAQDGDLLACFDLKHHLGVGRIVFSQCFVQFVTGEILFLDGRLAHFVRDSPLFPQKMMNHSTWNIGDVGIAQDASIVRSGTQNGEHQKVLGSRRGRERGTVVLQIQETTAQLVQHTLSMNRLHRVFDTRVGSRMSLQEDGITAGQVTTITSVLIQPVCTLLKELSAETLTTSSFMNGNIANESNVHSRIVLKNTTAQNGGELRSRRDVHRAFLIGDRNR
mmetsp:Transcript_19014/g.48362  ORF Transcript_19014/g.48362 Transcript_19014/m.48362 type:complete len:586 (-) Transcript_19014:539-2296(-)